MSLLVLLPTLLAFFVALGSVLHILKRKSLAQSICVYQATKLQSALKAPLVKLLRLNVKAQTLRARRETAEARVATARLTADPALIAAAEAARQAVILEQTALHGEQLAQLSEAQRLRMEGERDLRTRLFKVEARDIRTSSYYALPLAVAPTPATSLSPDYRPVATFPLAQQERFHFNVDLFAGFPRLNLDFVRPQTTECAVTLQERSGEWTIQILAAKAS